MTDMSENLTVPEIAKYLHVGRTKAYQLVRDPSFPSVKVGKSYIVPFEDLKKWLKQKMAEGKK